VTNPTGGALPNGNVFTLDDKATRLTDRSGPGGISAYTYDDDGRLTQAWHKDDSAARLVKLALDTTAGDARASRSDAVRAADLWRQGLALIPLPTLLTDGRSGPAAAWQALAWADLARPFQDHDCHSAVRKNGHAPRSCACVEALVRLR